MNNIRIKNLVATCLILFLSLVAWGESSANSPMLEKGLTLFYSGEQAKSIPYFKNIMDKDPNHTLATLYWIQAAKEAGSLEEKIAEYEEKITTGLNVKPADSAILGLLYFARSIETQDFDDALLELRTATAQDAELSIAYTGLGMIYEAKDSRSRAKGYFIRALRINSHDVIAMEQLGKIMLYHDEDQEGALSLFNRERYEVPSYPDAHYYYGEALVALERYSEAITSYKKVVELDPSGITRGYAVSVAMGETYEKMNEPKLAVKAYQRALSFFDNPYLQERIDELGGATEE